MTSDELSLRESIQKSSLETSLDAHHQPSVTTETYQYGDDVYVNIDFNSDSRLYTVHVEANTRGTPRDAAHTLLRQDHLYKDLVNSGYEVDEINDIDGGVKHVDMAPIRTDSQYHLDHLVNNTILATDNAANLDVPL